MLAWIAINNEPKRAFIFSRAFLVCITVLVLAIAAGKHGIPLNTQLVAQEVLWHNNPSDPLAYLLAWWRWDNLFYVQIATLGYRQAGLTVFFPLWPATIWLVGRLFALVLPGDISDYLSSILLANLFFFVALQLLYQLTQKLFDTSIAKIVIWLLAFFPYTLFFAFGYTESLFLLLCVATFVFLERGGMIDWWLASLCTGLAAVTRETGCVIIVAILTYFLQRFFPLIQHWRTNKLMIINAVCSLLLIPLGIVLYMIYLYLHWGNPLIFVHAAIAWRRSPAFPLTALFSAVWYLVTFSVPLYYLYDSLVDLCFTLLPIFLLIKYWHRLPLSYCLSAVALLLYSLSTTVGFPDPLMSAPRYLMVIFPSMMLLALEYKYNPACHRYIYIFFPLILTVNIVLFVIGAWVA